MAEAVHKDPCKQPDSLVPAKNLFSLAGTNLALILSSSSLPPPLCRYSGEPGGKGAPALYHDHPADQPARAAPGRARRTEEARRLADGKAEAANGVGASAAGTGNCTPVFSFFSFLLWSSGSFTLRVKDVLFRGFLGEVSVVVFHIFLALSSCFKL